MKTWKKFAAILLALGLTAGFAACGGGSDNGGNEGGDHYGSSSSVNVAPGVGEEVTEAEFQQAVAASYAAKNLTLVVTHADGVTTTNIADGKVHNVTVVSGMTVESYVGAVGGVYYQWISEYGDWYYEKLEGDAEYDPATGEAALSDILRWCEFSYVDFNETTGIYTFTNLGAPTVYAMVANGKIVKCGVESVGDDWVKMEITYGNASVGELPPLE